MTTFGMKVPYLWCDWHTSFKVKKSRSPRPLTLTHMVRHIFQTERHTKFKLGTRIKDNDPHQPQAPWAPRSKAKVARSHYQSWAVLAQCCTCVISYQRGHTMSAQLGGHTSCLLQWTNDIYNVSK